MRNIRVLPGAPVFAVYYGSSPCNAGGAIDKNDIVAIVLAMKVSVLWLESVFYTGLATLPGALRGVGAVLVGVSERTQMACLAVNRCLPRC